MTVRELMMAFMMNCNLDDKVVIEFTKPINPDDNTFTFEHVEPKRVYHLGDGEPEALIECHDF